jgi:hypothetical protein
MPTARYRQNRATGATTVSTVTHPALQSVREHPATPVELGCLLWLEHQVLAREGVYEIDSRRIYAAQALARLAAEAAA